MFGHMVMKAPVERRSTLTPRSMAGQCHGGVRLAGASALQWLLRARSTGNHPARCASTPTGTILACVAAHGLVLDARMDEDGS